MSVSVAMLDIPVAAAAVASMAVAVAAEEGVERDVGVRMESAMAVLLYLCFRGRRRTSGSEST